MGEKDAELLSVPPGFQVGVAVGGRFKPQQI